MMQMAVRCMSISMFRMRVRCVCVSMLPEERQEGKRKREFNGKRGQR